MKNKKFLIPMGCIITTLLIPGCGYGKNSWDENQEEMSAVSYDEVNLSELIPDPTKYFHNTKIETITSDDGYFVYLDLVSEEEWDTYIAECKKWIWTKEDYRSEYSWYVTSDDNLYRLSLDRYGDNNKYMSIIIGKVEESKDEK